MKTKILQQAFPRFAAGFVALFTLLVSASTAFSLTFTTLDFPDATSTSAVGINASGDIVGGYDDADGVGHGFLLAKGTFTTIDVPGATFSAAHGINSAGKIVGEYGDLATFVFHGFLLAKGTFTTIDVPWGVFHRRKRDQ